MRRRRLAVQDYTVGWVCALPVELAAAAEMLDEEHEDIPQNGNGTSIYTLGRIHEHNVVLACLPAGQTGTNSAATVATQMTAVFKSIKFGLMVGIGGGVPSSANDVRLGDVVVSQPHLQHGGVVQYDLGKTGMNGQFLRTGTMNTPPKILLNALAKIQANHLRNRSGFEKYLSTFDSLPNFNRESAGPDVLFKSTYHHAGENTCDACSNESIIDRSARDGQEIVIHYGTIASGNRVIKDGVTRDTLSGQLGKVLCFEMEAAGLMNDFPCLVIRGICDYADSHKNKKWQPYASATAAAFAKEVLSVVPGAELARTAAIDDLGPDMASPVPQFDTLTSLSSIGPNSKAEQRQQYFQSLKFDQIDARHATIKAAHAKTCGWILSRPEYKNWQDNSRAVDHHGLLWIKGKPGAGKSTIMKFVYATAKRTMSNSIVVPFFFNARGEHLERSTQGMYRSLLFQLLEHVPELQVMLDHLNPTAINENSVPSWTVETLQDLFRGAVELLGPRHLICFIDALDECDEDEVREMVVFFEELAELAVSSSICFDICFSSRHYPHITIEKSISLVLEEQEGHEHDIATYIRSELKAGRSKLIEDIKTEILERASGIFLWVVLVVRILKKDCDHGHVRTLRKRLDELPNGLDELFKDILMRDTQNMEELILCLRWVLFAKRPLKREELYFAVLAEIDPTSTATWDPEEVTEQDMNKFILSSSKGLADVTKTKVRTVQFIHESVRDYLLKGNGLGRLRNDLENNFHGKSHECLKQSCQNYVGKCAREEALSVPLPNASSKEAADLRKSASGKYPFLEYAVRHVLHHADSAGAFGVSQDRFVENFNTVRWITLSNVCQRYQIRRHTSQASFLYLVAEENLPSLIQVELARLKSKSISPFDIENERYGSPLLAALANSHEETVKALLLPRHEAVATVAGFQHGLFASAEDRGNTIRRMIRSGPAMVYKLKVRKMPRDPLSWALGTSSADFVKILVSSENITVTRSAFVETTHWAAAQAHFDILRYLFTSGRFEVSFSVFKDAMNHAISIGGKNVIEFLLELNLFEADLELSERLLFRAAALGYETIFRRFLAIVPSCLEREDYYGRSLLSVACANGTREVVKMILSVPGVDVNANTGPHTTALHDAISSCHQDIVQLLIDHGADVNKDASCGKPLISAIRKGHERIYHLLLDHGAQIGADDVKSGKYDDALSNASSHGLEHAVQLLLDTGFDVNSEVAGYTALQVAVQGGYERIAKLLLSKDANVNANGVSGSALFIANESGHVGIAQLLLEAGAKTIPPSNPALEDYQMQLMLLEQQNKKRLLMARQEQDVTAQGSATQTALSSNPALEDYQMQLMLLEQQNKKRLLMARQEQDVTAKGSATQTALSSSPSDDYQMQLMLLEQHNKKRLFMEHQEQDMLAEGIATRTPPRLADYQSESRALEQIHEESLSWTGLAQDINALEGQPTARAPSCATDVDTGFLSLCQSDEAFSPLSSSGDADLLDEETENRCLP